jgi:hypothetical protein
MQTQRKHAARSIVSNAATRGRLHNNIIHWRNRAEVKASLSKHVAPGFGGKYATKAQRQPWPRINKPFISAGAENIILALLGVAVVVVAIASASGAL